MFLGSTLLAVLPLPLSQRDRPSGGLVIGHGTKETQHHNVWRVLTAVTRLASVEQHSPRGEADRIGHQNDELPRGQPAHVAERQLRAIPDEPEEQTVDVLQVFPYPLWS